MVTSTGCVVTKIGNSSGAVGKCLRRFESPAASLAAKQGKHKSATKQGNSNGAMEEGLRRFESPVASQSAKQGKHKSATKHGNFIGSMERYGRFEW